MIKLPAASVPAICRLAYGMAKKHLKYNIYAKLFDIHDYIL